MQSTQSDSLGETQTKEDTLGKWAKFCAFVLLFQGPGVNGAIRAPSHSEEPERDGCAQVAIN